VSPRDGLEVSEERKISFLYRYINAASCSYTDCTIPASASGKHFLEHCPWSWQLLSWSNVFLMETNSPVLCSQQPAKGLSQMETAVFKFPPDFIPQKSAFCIFTLVGTSNLTVKLLVICFTLQCILLTVRNFSKWVSRNPVVLRRHARISAKRREYSLHAPHTPSPPYISLSVFYFA